jgi:8-amino-7-oxononanoate synthase
MKINTPIIEPKIFKKLEERIQSDSFRELIINSSQIDFYSNDYLGLSKMECKISKTFSGSTGSRLISGNSVEAENCEKYLADFFETESALVFNSGYDANLGLFSCIASKEDTIIYDELVHASIRDGIRLSFSQSFAFKHNDINSLKQKLKNAKGDIFLVVESLYSMDGDFTPLQEIVALKNEFSFHLIVDEAHACGIFGDKGKGLAHGFNTNVFAKIVTFGKAYGTHGAAILGSQKLKEYLINFARSFIYTTALPPYQYEKIHEAVESSKNDKLRENLVSNIKFYCSEIKKINISCNENSPIQLIQGKTQNELKQIYKCLLENNITIKIIKSPTVPKGKERIRVCLHAFNTRDEILKFVEILSKI